MKKLITILSSALLITFFSLSSMAVNYGDGNHPQNVLTGIKAIAVTIDPPTNYYYGELKSYGVSKENLEYEISKRLTNAGFDVISFSDSLEKPEAAVLNLKIRIIKGYGLIYSYGLNLSLNQKAPLYGDNAFHSIETWSDWLAGGTQQTTLRYLNGYAMQLVDNFIETHRAQN